MRKNSERAMTRRASPGESDRTVVVVRNAGAGRGARLMQTAVADWNGRSERAEIQLQYADPVPDRARLLVGEARARGITARATESRIEDVLTVESETETAPVLLNIDRPQAIASALGAVIIRPRAILGYLLMRMPAGELYGLRFVIQADDEETKRRGAQFFERLALVTARAGSSHVVGTEGRSEHLAVEPVYRDWFGRHMQENLGKITASLEPEASPFELTSDGRTTLPLLIEHGGGSWADPIELAQRVARSPSTPLVRGENFVVGEVGPDGIRLHQVRLRTTDGRLALQGTAVFDLAGVEREEERLVVLHRTRELTAALERATRETLSRTRPVFTTD
jgi:hypothetical protein